MQRNNLIKRLVGLVGCTPHALSSHPLMMHLPGEIELDESTVARRVVFARSSRAATSRGNGSRGGVSRSIVRMVREHARRITPATFSKPHHPDWISLEAPPSTRKNRPPREPPLGTHFPECQITHRHSKRLSFFAPPDQGVRDLCRSPCDAHTPQVHARSRFVVRARFSLRAAGRPRDGQTS